jgi:hypothetical protein
MSLIRAVVQAIDMCGGEPEFGNICRDYVGAVLIMLVGGFQAMTNMSRCPRFDEASDELLNTHRSMMWKAFWYVCEDLCKNLSGWNISNSRIQITNEQLKTYDGLTNAFISLIKIYNGN